MADLVGSQEAHGIGPEKHDTHEPPDKQMNCGRASHLPVPPRIAVALLGIWALACGDESVPPTDPVAPIDDNRAPVAVDTIGPLEVFVGDSVAIPLSPYFADADGDTLSFSAESSDTDAVAVSASRGAALISGRAPGTASVAVTASDPGGLSASLDFAVTVPNRPPEVRDSIMRLASAPDESFTIDLGAHFGDPDGEVLTFQAASSDTAVAAVSLAGSVVAVSAMALGSATLSFEALDPSGSSVTHETSINVSDDLDRDALVALYEQTDGPNWGQRRNWLTDAPLGKWHGVEVDDSGRVVELDLVNNRLSGPVPWELSGLEHLEALYLAFNNLSGPLPREFGRLAPIRIILMDGNELSGPIPTEIGTLSNLENLAVAGNQISGSLPPELGALGNLKRLWLHNNSLTGPIPPELGGLASLEIMNLARNVLSGPIPPELGRLGNLKSLSLAGNAFSGRIPAEFGDLASVESLYLFDASLSGPIPSELGNLGRLRTLDLSSNRLSGTIPSELANLPSLESLDVGVNELSGSIPPELGALAGLTSLFLNNNDLSGSIPPELGQLANLERLHLGVNDLEGPIPPELGNLTKLVFLGLNINALSGQIPAELGNLENLLFLWLRDNALSGPIPVEIANLRTLASLSLDTNALTGPIPPELGNLQDLLALRLYRNALTGPVPPELGRLSKLRFLSLQRNLLTGPLPRSFLELGALSQFGLGSNDGLCVPGVRRFVAWIDPITVDRKPFCNQRDAGALNELFDATGGSAWSTSEGWGDGLALDEWHGVVADSLGRVVELDLGGNGLNGRLPSALSQLDRMTDLRIGANDRLSGPLPLSLAGLRLRTLDYGGTGLCIPPIPSFREWLDGVATHEGTDMECPPVSQRDVLASLYDATAGRNWHARTNWMTDEPIDTWHGVVVDEGGRVVELRLGQNNLSGAIPTELGGLADLQVLRIDGNDLTGFVPPELGGLRQLRELDLSDNGLEGAIPPQIGSLPSLERLWLDRNDLTGGVPPELADLASLESINLEDNNLTGPVPAALASIEGLAHLRLGDNDFSGIIPDALGSMTALKELGLAENSLTGPLPPSLGSIATLEELSLGENGLLGPIPSELAQLTSLRVLALEENGLSGAIPQLLGNLSNLTHLKLDGNGLSGAIPSELAGLRELQQLRLDDNRLSGRIPPELGTLTELDTLGLSRNTLIGPIPVELGSLASLELLGLSGNNLVGTVPEELGNLTELKGLHLYENAGLSGILPATLANLQGLEDIQSWGTDLCAPDDPTFLDWLRRVPHRRVAHCVGGAAYLTQAIQSREYPVPLVAGEDALLRVFPTARRNTSARLPAARASFYLDGSVVHVADIPAQIMRIPTEVDESSLPNSTNAVIPGWVVQPSLEMVIELDPGAVLDPTLGVQTRIPHVGRLAQNVHAVPELDLTLIPFVWEESPDSAIIDLIAAMAADPMSHELLGDTRTLLPVADIDVNAHAPVRTSTNNAVTLLSETAAIRAMESGEGHYMGMMSGPVVGAAGVARAPGKETFSIPDARVVAHELGHNMSILHAPCGGPGSIDPRFPEPDGSIGSWGYDSRGEGRLVDPGTADLMAYCLPHWVSEFTFATALQHRLADQEREAQAIRTAPVRSLLLWGGADAEGNPSLEPALVVDAPPLLPDGGGDYELIGTTAGGRVLFSLTFGIPEILDADGSGAFAFVLPVRPGWETELVRISLVGPEGTATLETNVGRPLAVLRDSRSGHVRGILRDLPESIGAQAVALDALATGSRLELLFSRGVPGPEAWRR